MFWINKNRCTGCGICADLCPKGIEVIDGKARIIDENADCLNKAENACPRGAILTDEETNKENSSDLRQDYNQNNWVGQGAGKGRGMGRGGQGRGMGRGRW